MSVTYAQLEAARAGGFKSVWHARDHAIRHFFHVLEHSKGLRERLEAAVCLAELTYELLEHAIYDICAWQLTNKYFDRAIGRAIWLAHMHKDALEHVEQEIDFMFISHVSTPHHALEEHDRPFIVKHNLREAIWATKRLIDELEKLDEASPAMPHVMTKGERRRLHACFIDFKLRKWLEKARPDIFFTLGHNSFTSHVPDEEDIGRARRCLRNKRSYLDMDLKSERILVREELLALFEVR